MSIGKYVSFTASTLRLRVALLAVCLLGAVSAAAQSPAGCATTALPGRTFPLTRDTSIASSKGIDEWNSDVIRITVREPGLLVVSAEGPEVQGLVYTPDPAGGEPHLLDQKGIGTAGRLLAVAVDPGDYCLEIAPPAGMSGSVRVRAELIGLTVPSPE
jgi:hypothetical protein